MAEKGRWGVKTVESWAVYLLAPMKPHVENTIRPTSRAVENEFKAIVVVTVVRSPRVRRQTAAKLYLADVCKRITAVPKAVGVLNDRGLRYTYIYV